MKTTVKIALGMALLCSPTLAMAQSCMIDAEALRDACLDEDCLCAVYIAHTEASLGGLSPYQE